MTVFIDTSAVYALLDRADPRHPEIGRAFTSLTDRPLLTHSYVVLESAALVERRLGRQTARRLLLDILAPVDVVLVDGATHEAALGAYLAAPTGDLSLVDATSFEVMRARGIRSAFALDHHFADAGFDLIP